MLNNQKENTTTNELCKGTNGKSTILFPFQLNSEECEVETIIAILFFYGAAGECPNDNSELALHTCFL